MLAACTREDTGTAAYPTHPVTLVVPFAAGGPTDVLARTLAISMGQTLGQSVVVENRVGAGGTIGAGHVARARPDGYTLLLHHNGMATGKALYSKLAYDPLQSFEFVGQVVDVPMTLIGRRDFPPDTAQELFAYIKANRDTINLAQAGAGAVSHLCALLLQRALGVEITTVQFQGTAPALVALVGGHVDLLCDQTTQTIPHIHAGRVKLYGATTRARIKALPDAPTLQESGLPDFEVVVWHGIYAPKGTPQGALDKVNAALRIALKDPTVTQRLAELGAQIVPESKQTPAGLRDWLQAEIDKWTPVLRSAGVSAD
ncbi:MAG TPA: tripartite tricarboxylate transporter substrate-binding protein [Burkholderiales bacterium]